MSYKRSNLKIIFKVNESISYEYLWSPSIVCKGKFIAFSMFFEETRFKNKHSKDSTQEIEKKQITKKWGMGSK